MNGAKLVSWNINGLRAIYGKGFLDWVRAEDPDILCLQETKATEEQIPAEILTIPGYHCYFATAQRRGYSGVGLLTKPQPDEIVKGLGLARFDDEGRVLIAHYADFVLFNIYFPNGGASAERLQFKLAFYDALLEAVAGLSRGGRNVVICGDVNTAHREIDLARPKENEKVSGFLPEERAWIDRLIAHGFVDTFRMFHREGGHYSWWDFKTRARVRNVGWRIDYFFVTESLQGRVEAAFILPDVMGSDHCPVGIRLRLAA